MSIAKQNDIARDGRGTRAGHGHRRSSPRSALGIVAAAAALSAAAPAADAALAYSAGAANFPGTPGSTVSVPIYVSDSASTIASGGGLFSAGFRVTRTTSPGAAIVNYARNTAFFDFTSMDSNYTSMSAGLSVDQSNGTIMASAVPDANGLLRIGTLSVLLTNTPGQVTNFTIGDFDPITTQFVTNNFNELDAQIAGGGFTVSAVPEPTLAGVALACTAVGGLLSRRRRRRGGAAVA